MKTLIVYFSQTGNTFKIARCIRDGVMDVTGQCDLASMGDVDADSLKNHDLVGIGCSVFYYQEPLNVRDFLERLPDLTDSQWFVFCTHGSVMGNTLVSMTERLQKKGVRVVGYHDSYADATLPFYPHPTLTTGHPDSVDMEQALAFGKEIVERSQRIAQGDNNLIPKPGAVPEEWIRAAETMNSETLGRVMPGLRINTKKCTHCHSCEDNCPVKGIDVEAVPPRIQTPCVYCYYCAKICPTLAVEADWNVLVDMAPKNYARYRQVLDEAESRGEFRWLVDPDSMNFDEPLYKQRQRELETKEPEDFI